MDPLLHLLPSLPGFVAITDRGGKVLECGGGLLREERARPEGLTLTDLVAPQHHAELVTALGCQAEGRRTTLEVQARGGDWCQLDLVTATDQDGARRVLVLATDITERHEREQRIEAERRASESRFAQMADALPVLISYVDSQERYVFSNALYRAWFGTPAEGRLIRDVVGEAAYEAIKPFVDAVLAGRSVSFERELDYAVAGRRWIHADYVPHVDADGAVVGFFALVTDHTERRKMEEELLRANKMEAIARLASGVAHDFNNLLMGIGGAAAVALTQLDAASPVRTFLSEILSSVKSGSAISRQLLELGTSESGDTSPVEVDATIERLEPIIRRLVGNEVALHIELDAPGARVCGAGQIEQMVLNFVVNARDAIPDAGTITIATCEVDVERPRALVWGVEPGTYVLLTVSDTGTGMDERTKSRLFEPFFTTKDQGRGTGLGLATVYGIVRRQHGHIEFSSEVGEGTTFSVFLPVVAEAEAEAAAETEAETGPVERALLVEDDPLVRRALVHYLRQGGYEVLEAADATSARELFASSVDRPISMLLTDVVLPDRSGPLLAQELRAEEPELRVAFMSAHPRSAFEGLVPLDPDALWLQKPFSKELLLESLDAMR